MNLFRVPLKRRHFLSAMIGTATVGGLGRALGPLGAIFLRGTNARAEAVPTDAPRRLRAAIVYYSATGSTLKAAKAIHRGLSTVMDCDLFPIKKANPKAMAKYDLIGLGGPIWYSRETANLKLFVHDMPKMPGKMAFLFCTHGVGPDGFMWSFSQTVVKRELTIIGWSDWYGSVFHVLHQPKPYHTDGHPDATDLQEAEAFGHMIGEKAEKIAAGDSSLIPDLPTSGSLWLYHGMGLEGGGGGGGMPGGGGPGASSTAGSGGASGAGKIPAAGAAAAGAVAMSASGGGRPAPGGAQGGDQQMAGGGPGGGGPGGGQQMAGGGPGGGGPSGQHVAATSTPRHTQAKTVAGAAGAAGPGGGPGGPGGGPPGMGGSNRSTKLPDFDMTKCVYPRCNACEDMCPVNAIDFSISAPGRLVGGDAMLVKKACISCSLCERVCIYDGVVQGDNGPRPKTSHAIDMKKCTYPKCKLCLDNCPQNAIDFSYNPPLFHHDCEGCDMCYCVCPTGAVSIPNFAISQLAMANRGPQGVKAGQAAGPGAMNGGAVGDSAAFLPENIALRAQGVSPHSSQYRRLVPLDKIGYDHLILDNQNKPIIIVDPENGNTTYCSTPCKV